MLQRNSNCNPKIIIQNIYYILYYYIIILLYYYIIILLYYYIIILLYYYIIILLYYYIIILLYYYIIILLYYYIIILLYYYIIILLYYYIIILLYYYIIILLYYYIIILLYYYIIILLYYYIIILLYDNSLTKLCYNLACYGSQSTVSNNISFLCSKYGLCRYTLPNYLPSCSYNNDNNAPSVSNCIKAEVVRDMLNVIELSRHDSRLTGLNCNEARELLIDICSN